MSSKVLIISSDYKNIELLQQNLVEKHCEVLLASNINEAVEIVKLVQFDFILLDTNFVKQNIEVLSILKDFDLPVMLISDKSKCNTYSKLMEFVNNIDNLTGIHDRGYFDSKINKLCSDAIANNFDLSLVIMDMDFFRDINNSKGHLAGDKILNEVAKIIRAETRPDDVAVRFGGEEFAFVFENVAELSAVSIAERLRVSILKNLGVTASFGVTILTEHDSVEEFVNRADEALYQAKNSGRNKVVIL